MLEIKKVETKETGTDAYIVVQNQFLKGEKGDFPQEEANYAKSQGDYAKSQGDYAKQQSDIVQLAENIRIEAENTRQVQENARQTNTQTAINNCEVATSTATTVANQILNDKESGVFKGEQGIQGIQGLKGDAFNIKKTFTSISLMQESAGLDLTEGDFVLISNNNVQDTDNSKLYVWTGTTFNYLTDLSGATGIQGEQGIQGIQGEQGTIVYEELADYDTYVARKTAGTLANNVVYFWGE